ncbi:metallophosphoesterase family protein [Vagococcus sp. WN89Y]|uniref:metallophosphoesterase family protein n=1 Tax=Vagococcus sp. WN89Y TaxID=3457258 RepID=UPI003FCC7F3D
MKTLFFKYSLLSLAVLCFSAFSADTTSTTDTSTSQTTSESASTATADSSTTETTSGAGIVTVNFFNSSDLELSKVSSTLADACWGSGAPDTVPANGHVTLTTTVGCTGKPSSTPGGVPEGAGGTVEYQASSGERFTLTLTDNSSNLRLFAANSSSSSDQYSLTYTEDVDQDNDGVLINYFLTTLSTPTYYSIIVGSDTQAWRLDNSADPNNNQGPWEAFMRSVLNGMGTYASYAKFMIINGDVTEFGRDAQRSSYDGTLNNGLDINYYWSLGNHDYANNVGDCTDWPDLSYNACARHSVQAMAGAIVNYYVNFLPEVTYNWNTTSSSGSLAYAWSYGNIRFIQLQNYPTYDAWLDHWALSVIDINPSLAFLQQELNRAQANGQVAVVNMHDAFDHFKSSSTPAQRNEFNYLMNNYPVLAVFAGHTHQAGVANRNGGDSFFGRVPVYNSGALFKGDFLDVDFSGKCMSTTQYNAKTGYVNYVSYYGQLCMTDVEQNNTGSSPGVGVEPFEVIAQIEAAGKAAEAVHTPDAKPTGIQIATRGENALCLAAVAGANVTLDDCSKPETFFSLEERSGGYNKFVSTVDSTLCLKTNSADDNLSLGACKGDNTTDDLTSMRLWLLPNNQESYFLVNKYKTKGCVRATGESASIAEIANCNTTGNDDTQASREWVLKRDGMEIQPSETSGQ